MDIALATSYASGAAGVILENESPISTYRTAVRMFSIKIVPGFVIINQYEYVVKLRNPDFAAIIRSKENHVELNEGLTFFRRQSGNVTFVFFETDASGQRTPTLSRIDVGADIWQGIINKRTFLQAPLCSDGLCTACGASCRLTVHHNCSQYIKILDLFLETVDGRKCMLLITKTVKHLYDISKRTHLTNKYADVLMYLNYDVTHEAFCELYTELIGRKDHPFVCETNFSYFIKTCSAQICDHVLSL